MEYIFAYICLVKPKDPEKINQIHAATLALVRAHGLTGLTMALIGKKAGLGMGTLYVYYTSKEALINNLFKTLKTQNTARIYKGLKNEEGFKLALKGLVINYLQNRFKYYEEHFFIEQCVHSHFLDASSRAIDEEAYIGFYALLEKGKKELLIKPLPNDLLTSFLIGGANELVNRQIHQNTKPGKTFFEQCFQLCWDTIKT